MEALLYLFLIMGDESFYNQEQEQKPYNSLSVRNLTLEKEPIQRGVLEDLQRENSVLRIQNAQLKNDMQEYQKIKHEIMEFLTLVQEKNGEKQCPFLCHIKELCK